MNPESLEMLRGWLACGQYTNAADTVKAIAETASERKLRDLVRVLEDGLRAIPDKHEGRGSPTRKLSTKEVLARGYAVRDYRGALLARRLLDSKRMDATQLAALAWLLGVAPEGIPSGLEPLAIQQLTMQAFSQDVAGARQELKPHAHKLLASYGLLPKGEAPRRAVVVPSKGFESASKRIIAEHWEVQESYISRTITELLKLTQ